MPYLKLKLETKSRVCTHEVWIHLLKGNGDLHCERESMMQGTDLYASTGWPCAGSQVTV